MYRPTNDPATFLWKWGGDEIVTFPERAMCLHCGESAHRKSQACPLPVSCNMTTGQYSGLGVFCCPGCALGYAKERNMHNFSNIVPWMHDAVRKWTKRDVTIRPALPSYFLDKYAGPLSLEEFDTKSDIPYSWTNLDPCMIMATSAVQHYVPVTSEPPSGPSGPSGPTETPAPQAPQKDLVPAQKKRKDHPKIRANSAEKNDLAQSLAKMEFTKVVKKRRAGGHGLLAVLRESEAAAN